VQATPILLIPGLNCTERLFQPQLPALWQLGPVTLANHAFGETIPAVAANILAAAPPRFALAGLSLGGYLALEVMRQAPERVERLALLDTSARPDTPAQTAKRHERIALSRAGRFRETLEEQYPFVVHPDRHGDAALREAFIAMAEANGPETFIRQSLAIAARPDSRPGLGAIRVPTLVLVGDHDELTPPDCAEEMAAGINGARLVTVPGCGHMSTLEKPDAVTAALVDWLRG
jgi:pimeloyl-ACP methyl ester carboxylesterase